MLIIIFASFSIPDRMHTIVQLFLISLACLTISAHIKKKSYTLKVTEDVCLERGSRNYNYLPYLLIGTHPRYPLKRSLLKFQNIPSECTFPSKATLHIFFVYAHKASFMSVAQVPAVKRYIVAYTVLKSWTESQATSTKRNKWARWDKQWLNLGTDAESLATSSTTVTPSPGLKLILNIQSPQRTFRNCITPPANSVRHPCI